MASGGLQPLPSLDDNFSGATLLSDNTASYSPPSTLGSPASTPAAKTGSSDDSSDATASPTGLGSLLDPTGGALGSLASGLSSVSISRLVAIALGLILIAVGLIMFRPVNQAIGEASKSAAKAAAATA